jgi:hypothetical protein
MDEPYCFGVRSKIILNKSSLEGQKYRIASTGIGLMIETFLYVLQDGKLISIDIMDKDSEEEWTIKNGIYRKIFFRVFQFYQSFDVFAFDFPEM